MCERPSRAEVTRAGGGGVLAAVGTVALVWAAFEVASVWTVLGIVGLTALLIAGTIVGVHTLATAHRPPPRRPQQVVVRAWVDNLPTPFPSDRLLGRDEPAVDAPVLPALEPSRVWTRQEWQR